MFINWFRCFINGLGGRIEDNLSLRTEEDRMDVNPDSRS